MGEPRRTGDWHKLRFSGNRRCSTVNRLEGTDGNRRAAPSRLAHEPAISLKHARFSRVRRCWRAGSVNLVTLRHVGKPAYAKGGSGIIVPLYFPLDSRRPVEAIPVNHQINHVSASDAIPPLTEVRGFLAEMSMNNTATETLSVVVEREIAVPPEKIWRALTQPHLIEEWLMKNDFKPVVDHRFSLRADWGVVDCQVMAVEPNKTLSYTWAAYGLESVVTWTLTPTSTGTRLRMEQSGFRPDQQQAYQGAKYGWQRFFANLEQVLARID